MQPTIKRLWVSITLVTLVGITTTWLSSCSNTEAAADNNNNPDPHIELNQSVQVIRAQVTDAVTDGTVQFKLSKILGTLDGSGGNTQAAAGSFSELVQLTSKLSDDIGKMSLQIGYMADRIVETEKLIVSVIVNQTAASSTILAGASLRDPVTGAPNGKPLLSNPPFSALDGKPLVGFAEIQAAINGGGGNGGVLLASTGMNVTNIPILSFDGNVVPNSTPYMLLVSTNPTFNATDGTTINKPVNFAATLAGAETLATVWPKSIAALKLTPGNTVFVAVKTITGTTVSGLSNSVDLTIPTPIQIP